MKTISLTKGKNTIVDDEDFSMLSAINWYARPDPSNKFSAKNDNFGEMHRFIMNCPEGFTVDHINGDSLDNRRENLRICTLADNLKNKTKYKNNKSGFKGVYWDKHRSTWIAEINIGNKKIRKSNKDLIEAAKYYDLLARRYFGEFAKTNF